MVQERQKKYYPVTLCIIRLHYALSGYIIRYEVTLCVIGLHYALSGYIMRYQVTLCVMRLHYALSGYIMHYQVTLCIIRVRVTMHYKGASFMRYQGHNMRYQGYNMRHQVTLCIIRVRVLCVIRVRVPTLLAHPLKLHYPRLLVRDGPGWRNEVFCASTPPEMGWDSTTACTSAVPPPPRLQGWHARKGGANNVFPEMDMPRRLATPKGLNRNRNRQIPAASWKSLLRKARVATPHHQRQPNASLPF